MTVTRLTVKPTRTEDGKKIDTWHVSTPDDGSAEITVTMHASRNEMYFRARSRHPLLKELAWEGSDIAQLRTTVAEEVEQVLSDHHAGDWVPMRMLELALHETNVFSCDRLKIEFGDTPVRRDTRKSPGNRGETRVMVEGKPGTIVQRAADATFETDGSLDPSNIRLSRENDERVSRVLVSDEADTRAGIAALREALRRFSGRLQDRMAPDVVAAEGLPDPEDLAEMMRDAASNNRESDIEP